MANKIDLITAKEAAAILKYKTPDKVYLLIRSKLIRGFKLGRQYLIDRESLYEYCRCQLGCLPSHDSDKHCDTILREHDIYRISRTFQ